MTSDPPSSDFGQFLAELKRRHVVRAAIAYAAVVFVVLQAAEIVLPAFLRGTQADATLRVLVVALALLFPVVLVLAWVYEITPQGIRAMTALDAESGRVPVGHLLPRVAFLAVTVLAAGGAGLWWYRTDAESSQQAAESRRRGASTIFQPAATTDASGPIRSLAVLPLENFSPESAGEQDYFVAGMHEALVSQLSQLSTVRVISRTSAAQVERQGKSLPQLGAELGVDAVVEGSVLRADGRVRITVQLIHAASDTHLWARDYERDLVDVIALQREVSEAIAGEIHARLAAREAGPDPTPAGQPADRLATGPDPATSTPSTATGVSIQATPPVAATPEVQDAVFRGRFALDQQSPEHLDDARRHFQEALRLDSSYAPALVGLAGTRLAEALSGERGSLTDLLDARRLAMSALEADPASIEAEEVLGSAEQALGAFGERMERTGAGSPGRLRVVHLPGDSMVLVVDGDSVRLPTVPAAPVTTEFGSMLQTMLATHDADEGVAAGWLRGVARLEAAGRLRHAREQAEQAAERFPDQEAVLAELERLQALTGQVEAAVGTRALRQERFGRGPGPDVAALRAAVSREGARGYWGWRLESIEARRRAGEEVSWVVEAEALAQLGRHDEALSALGRAREEHDPRLVGLRSGPVWDALRADPRFQALVRRGRNVPDAP
jgi:TolB-like protein/tetratricopeptide (TPR) repeat protein